MEFEFQYKITPYYKGVPVAVFKCPDISDVGSIVEKIKASAYCDVIQVKEISRKKASFEPLIIKTITYIQRKGLDWGIIESSDFLPKENKKIKEIP